MRHHGLVQPTRHRRGPALDPSGGHAALREPACERASGQVGDRSVCVLDEPVVPHAVLLSPDPVRASRARRWARRRPPILAGAAGRRRVLHCHIVVAGTDEYGSRRGDAVATEYDVEGEVDVFLESSVGRWYWLSNVLFFLVVSAFFALHLIVRRRIVLKYAIEEHPALSCVLVLACPCCAVAQSAIHVDLVEHGAVQQDCSCAPKHPLADRTTNGDVLGDVEML
eukprot:CAMPEP_0180018252 /NCGR_PEP_ID=MMETSP0984-20121128/20362_1 /TAXON_ID=483367 /ORGANISM="non described non described, Strain CCMP 2436" /LENGTH=224 /DNA_ID=CAMNT_0021941483 /DNA_START=1 /DNA_END=676 /DNA_ORIENTATION=-